MSPRIILCFRILLCVALVVFTYLLLNKPSGNTQGLMNDKLAHAIGFWGLSFLADLAFPRVRFFWKALLLCSYGLLTEYLQLLTGYREFSWWDWLADIVGVLAMLPVRGRVHHMLASRFPNQGPVNRP